MGVIAAAVEGLTEKYSLEALLDDSVKGWRYIAQNALTEASEETASSAINFMADIAVSKEKLEWIKAIERYEKSGHSAKEAYGKAFGDQLLSIGLDALGGAISGGVLAGSISLINSVSNSRENRAERKAALAGLREDAQKELAKREGMQPITEADAPTIAPSSNGAQGVRGITPTKTTPSIVLPTAETAGQTITLPTAKDAMGQNAEAANGGMTEEDYDARMDVLEAEASMAGESMLYEDGRQFSIVGKTEDGRKIYKTNYPKGTPKAVKQNDVIQMVQNIWSKKPIELTIVNEETGETETITAKFNPELGERSDLSKIAFGNRKGTGSEKRMTLDLAPDFYQIAQDASHTGGKAETGKDNPAHDDVKRWEYFVTNLVYEDEQGMQTDAHMNIDVKRTSDGEFFYSFGMEKGTAPQALLAVVDEDASPTVPENSIPQSTPDSQENSGSNLFGPTVLPTAKEQMEQAKREKRAAKAKTETERTGILLGVPDKIIQEAVRISKALGVDVLFYRNTGGKVTNDRGYYNHNNGKIYLNADITDPIAFILGHEMIHDIQLTDGYIKFADAVLKKIQKDGGDLAAIRKELRDRYARNGVKLDSIAKIDQDVIAEYAQEHLFTDEASIVSVVNADKESGNAILRFLDKTLAALGNTNARERVFVEKARSLYAAALRQNAGMKNAERWKGETKAAQTQTTADYASGDMTDAEYDERMDVLEAERSMAGESMLYEDGRQFAIGKDKGVAKRDEKRYNNLNDKSGGESHADTGKHDSVRTTQLRENEKTGIYRRTNQENAPRYTRHTEGEKGGNLPSYPRENDGDIPKRGIIKSVFHGTPYRFKAFLKSYIDIGIHFGTKAQAEARLSDVKGHIDEFDLRIENPLVTKDIFGERVAEQYAEEILQEANLSENEKTVFQKELDEFYNSDIKMLATDSLKEKLSEGKHKLNVDIQTDGIHVTLALVDDELKINEIPMAELIDKNKLVEILGFKDTIQTLESKSLSEKAIGKITPYIFDAVLPFEVQFLKLRKIESILQSFGYDGFAYRNENEGEGWSYAVFDDSQIIRKTDITNEDLLERQYAIAKDSTAETVAENLPRKAQAALSQTENRLSERIGEILGVPKQAQREYLKEIIRDISEDYLQSGTIDRAKADALFEEAYKQGIVVDADYYEKYKHIRDHLRDTQLTISPEDSSSIVDFNAFRKSTFRKLRIVNEGGLPVDVAYAELTEMAPELFPEDITHPADQLQHMFEIADGIRKTEQTLDEAYGEDAETFKEAARDEFHAALNSAAADFKRVKRYSEDRNRIAGEQEAEKKETVQSREELDEAYKNLKTARRNMEKVKRSALLTEQDEMRVGQLLRGEISPMMLDPETDNVKDILTVYRAKQEYEKYAKRIRDWNRRRREGLAAQAREYLTNIRKWKDKVHLGGLRYSRETMERNFRDIMGTDADALIAEYLTPVHKAQAAATRLKNEMRGKVKSLQLSRKVAAGNTVSEAHAVQLLGEAEDNIAVLKVMPKDTKRDGKTLSEWEGTVAKLWAENPNLDKGKIRGAVQTFRDIYDDLFAQMNEARVRNGYEPVNYRRGYFPHFQPGDEGVLAQFGRALGIDTAVSALPTTINGMTHVFKPGIRWLGNAQERLGFNTVYDAVEGFDKYIEGVADVIHQIDNIQKLRALAKEIRYAASDEGVKKQVDQIEANPALSRDEKDALISQLYENAKFALGNFVVELDEYTNLLANKKSRADREMERKLGRGMYNIMQRVNGNVAGNMVALNIPSWLTNFIPLTQAWGLVNTRYLLRGMGDTIKAYHSGDDIVSRSTFLTNRRGTDPLVQIWEQGEEAKNILGKMWRGYQAGVNKLSGGMEFIDAFTSDSIVRAKYYQNLDAGMSEAAAMDDADAFAAGVMADRSKGAMPTTFHETNPVKKLFTQFQLEVNNQYSYMFKDMPRAVKERGMAEFKAVLKKRINEKEEQYNALLQNLSSGALPPAVLTDLGKKMQKIKEEIESLKATEPPKEFAAPVVLSWLENLKNHPDDEAVRLLIERIDVKSTTDFNMHSTLKSVVGKIGCGGRI